MLRQDLDVLNQELPYKSYGCKISSYLFWLEQVSKIYLSAEEIIRITKRLISCGYLRSDLFIGEDYEYLLPKAIGIPVKDSKRTGSEYVCKWNELEILWLQKTTKKDTYNHFDPGDGWGRMVWDSLGIRLGRDDYEIAGKRIMILEEDWCRKHWRSE